MTLDPICQHMPDLSDSGLRFLYIQSRAKVIRKRGFYSPAPTDCLGYILLGKHLGSFYRRCVPLMPLVPYAQ